MSDSTQPDPPDKNVETGPSDKDWIEEKTLVSKDKAADAVDAPTRLSSPNLAPENRSSRKIGMRPHRIGSFELVRKIGEGGMGTVYLARQEQPNRHVALKMIRSAFATKNALRRFRFEAEVLGKLDHEGIGRIYEAGTVPIDHGRLPYFAMEYIEGEILSTYVQTHHCGQTKRLELFLKICDAVQFAHNNGFIHRDLKPGNVMVNDRGQPKILDFGLARATEANMDTTSFQTRTGQILGTLSYMSPEQCQGNVSEIDTRSDVYSLGVILFELLADRLPYDLTDKSLAAALQIIREADPIPLRSISKTYRGDLETIVLKSLEKSPDKRYQSTSELSADLRRYFRDQPILARPPSAIYQLRKLARRHRGLVIGLAIAFLILAVGSGLTTWQAIRATKKSNEVLRLSDVKRLTDLKVEADLLWPPYPNETDGQRFRDWIGGAQDLIARLPEHRETLQKLRSQGEPAPEQASSQPVSSEAPDPPVSWIFSQTESQWHHDVLADLVKNLEALSDPVPQRGLLADVRDRFEFTSNVFRETVEKHKAVWEETLLAIGDPKRCPAYDGLALTPQIGLIPIGQDPDSHLFEFAHVQSGVPPARVDGRLVMTEESSLVLVLLPGGTFNMGSRLPASNADLGQPNVDPKSQSDERPVHEIRLDPFMISKYEMTQSQWTRITGANPSTYPPEKTEFRFNRFKRKGTLLHPVENVSWNECSRILQQMRLRIPTEAQWEYAARGDTTSVYWSGDDPTTLDGVANFADAFSLRFRGQRVGALEIDDGYVIHAPVGSFQANRFGLHEILGNVAEWCRDRVPGGATLTYKLPATVGEGERKTPTEDDSLRPYRGGHFFGDTTYLRSAARDYTDRSHLDQVIGIRPVWALTD